MAGLDKKNVGLLFALIVSLHLSKIPNGFTWLDHRDIESGRSLFGAAQFFSSFGKPFSDTQFYRPLVSLVHSLNFMAFGLHPFAFHSVNVILHGLVCITLAICAKVVFGLSERGCLGAAFCMGISPTSFLPAGQISHVSELLLALFYLLSLIFYRLQEREGLKRYMLLYGMSFWLALLAKESAIVFIPATLFILSLFSNGGIDLKKVIRLLYLNIIQITLYLVLRFRALPQGWSVLTEDDATGSWLAVRLVNYGNHLAYLLNPFSPKLSDTVSSQTFMSLTPWIYLLLFALSAWALFRMKDLSLRIPLVLLFFLALPTLNFLPLPRFFSSHYLYLPSLMFSIVLAVLLTRKNNLMKWIILPWIVIATMSSVFSGKRLQDDLTLFGPEVSKDDNYREGHFYLGGYFLSHAKPAEAEKHYLAALKPLPGFYSFSDPMAGSIGLALTEISLKNYSDAAAVIEAIEPNAHGHDLENLNKIKGLLP